jgi:acyl carrier protein
MSLESTAGKHSSSETEIRRSRSVASDVNLEDLRMMIAEELELPVEEVTDEADLKDDLDVDSLAVMEIAVQLEKKYRIKLIDDEIKSLKTLMIIHELVSAKVDTA